MQLLNQSLTPQQAVRVSIPQAVGAVATGNMDDKQFTDELVSIPQAVSTVAMMVKEKKYITGYQGFNTVNGKFSPH